MSESVTTSINSDAFAIFLDQKNYVKRNKIERKSLFDLRGIKSPAIGKKANLVEVYNHLIFDYAVYCELCINHDLEFQGKILGPGTNLSQNPEISLADNVDNYLAKIVVLWIRAQEMLSNSFMRENLVRANKFKSFPKKESSEFLETSKGHRIHLISAFYDALLVSFAYLLKELNIVIDTETDVSKWKSILEHTYQKIISQAIEGAEEVGVASREIEELWELFEIETLLESGLKLYL